MVSIPAERLQKNTGAVRAEARRAPVEITYHGRPELILLSVEDYALLRTNRRLPMRLEDMPTAKVARIAGNRMAAEHDALDALLDD